MRTIPKMCVLPAVLLLAFSCKQASESNSSAEEAASEQSISSVAAVEKPQQHRKFVRTADIKFKVKDVAKSTYAVENAVDRFGGFVTNTNLQSDISEKRRVKISAESILETTKFTVGNNMTIRVPNTKLDTVLKTISRQVGYLDYRVIKADDVNLKMLANDMAQSRQANHDKRLENAIEGKVRKLNDISNVENRLLENKALADNSKIENLSLEDQVAFSTVTLQLYQNEMIRRERLADMDAMTPRAGFGFELWDSIKTGWYIVASVIVVVLRFWAIALLMGGGWLLYRRFIVRKRVAA